MDFRGVEAIFFPSAKVWVSSLLTNRLQPFPPDDYFIDLYGLCHGGRYDSVRFAFDRVDRKKISMFQKGDSVFVTVKIVQWFTGIARDPARDYADKTIKSIEVVCYYDGEYLTGKISNIFVDSTKPVNSL